MTREKGGGSSGLREIQGRRPSTRKSGAPGGGAPCFPRTLAVAEKPFRQEERPVCVGRSVIVRPLFRCLGHGVDRHSFASGIAGGEYQPAFTPHKAGKDHAPAAHWRR